MSSTLFDRSLTLHQVLLAVLLFFSLAQSAFVDFHNCLSSDIVNSEPRILQITPLNVSAVLGSTSSNTLNVTFYGNVSGALTLGDLPSADNTSYWSDPNNTFGKIQDVVPGDSKATTLFAGFSVLSYMPWTANAQRFCEDTVNSACPLAPSFYVNSTQIDQLSGWTIQHNLYSSYAFATIAATTRIESGGDNSQYYACVSAYITPDLGSQLGGLLRYLPLGILIVVGVATIAAATYSPWGSVDIFRWSSNFGRDPDVLRLVTPGFGDCLQYIQFIVFTGSLSLAYPGFYQPVVSRAGWSTLLFNESMVTGGSGRSSVVDGVYEYRPNSGQGLDRMSQLIGMESPGDAWADMMAWLLVIIACVIVLTQLGFAFRWIYRRVKDVPAGDLRSKNWYFSIGNVVRITFGFFLLPLVALSMYQLVIAGLGPTYCVALAAVVLVIIIAFSIWLVFLFIRTRPRSFLFDDLQTVLAYGPLYNTYKDDAMTFALVPIMVNILRGIAVGAVQASGIVQIVLLAICEVILILAVNAQRPFAAATSMNLYQTCFAVIRLLTIVLLIAFVPSLDTSQATRGWIGYAILLIHACVLVFGFFLNAIQTLIEVIARLTGAGATGHNDAARGGLVKVFGMRQLSRRRPARDPATRASMGSNAQMLVVAEDEKNLDIAKTRSHSVSASSMLLIDSNGVRREKRQSRNLDRSSGHMTPEAMSTFSRLSRNMTGQGGIVNLQKSVDARDAYYRPPRRNTMDLMTRPEGLNESQDGQNTQKPDDGEAVDDGGEGSSHNVGKVDREDIEETHNELTKTKTDYAVREVDFYYGLRGPALSSGTRKLKTGPADPTGPVSSARGWFNGLLGGKTKEKGKGFEVVRSARAPPPGMMALTNDGKPDTATPYRDDPVETRAGQDRPVTPRSEHQNVQDDEEYEDVAISSDDEAERPRSATQAPSLPLIDTVGAIELPSRIGSEASRRHKRPVDEDLPEVPTVPRRSSRRQSDPQSVVERSNPRIPPAALASTSPIKQRENYLATSGSQRLPFSRTASKKKQDRYSAANSEASSYMHAEATTEQENAAAIERPGSVGFVSQHRASENIRYTPDEAQISAGSTVEYGYHRVSADGANAPFSPAWNGSSAADGSRRFSRFRD